MAQSEIYSLDTINFGVGGSTDPIRFYLRNKNSEIYDATGCTVYLAISKFGFTQTTPDVSKTLTLIADDEGLYSIAQYTPLASDTINLEGKYEYEITIKDLTNSNSSEKGIMYISKNINKSVLS
jgi:hypothetical protein